MNKYVDIIIKEAKKSLKTDDVPVGANAVVIEGVGIRKGAVVAAGAIVTADVPPGMVAAGCPARIIKAKDDKTSMKTALEQGLRNL